MFGDGRVWRFRYYILAPHDRVLCAPGQVETSNMMLLGMVPTWLSAWLTPFWLLGMGALLGLVILLVVWGTLWLVYRPAAEAIPAMLTECVPLPILVVTGALALFGILGVVLVRDSGEHFHSLRSWVSFSVGTTTREFSILESAEEGDEGNLQEIEIAFSGDELRELRLSSDEDLIVMTPKDENGIRAQTWLVTGGQPLVWTKGDTVGGPLFGKQFDRLLVRNAGGADTTLSLVVTTAPIHPQVASVPMMAISVVAVFLLYFLIRFAMPKLSAVALATAKSEMSQPLFLILVAVGVFLLFLFIYIPYFTFDEDVKVLKDSGMTLIMVFCILQAIWGASTSVSEELEGRTALTVLSKPIGRREFILGKFTGIVWTVAVMFILLGFVFLLVVAYKPIFDARESAATEPPWQVSHLEIMRTVPGLVLAFLETVVMASISVAIATRLPMLANFLICFSIYVAGHLTPTIVQSSVGERFEPVQFVGQLIAVVFPVLDHFNIQAAVAAGVPVPWEYLLLALLYCVVYSTVAMLGALVLFENRDLA